VGKPEEIFKVEGKLLTKRPLAMLFRIHDEKVWIPRSHLFDEEDIPDSGHCQIKMSAWIAKKKGII
jgi:hypothetical protein